MKVSALFFLFLLSATNLFGLTPWQTFLNEVKAKAESGDADSQGILSVLVRIDAISGSAEDAFSLAEKAANKSLGFGTYALGMCHLDGVGTIKNKEKAIDLLTKALPPLEQLRDVGNPIASVIISGYFIRPLGISLNEAETLKWLRLAADQGNAWAQRNLGYCYFEGKGVSKDEAEGVKWLRLAADQGNSGAQGNLGYRYFEGKGVSKDEAEGVKWLRLAADQGISVAQASLGECYLNGKGVSKDEAEGMKWLRLAADQGDAWAQRNLGVCYLNGKGVSKNEKQAMELFRLAADQGNEWAQANLGDCYLEGKGANKDETEAVKWFRLAADQGNWFAQRTLGLCCEFGKGVSKDDKKAAKWYRLAADQGDLRARSLLAHMQTTENNVSESENIKAQTLVVKGFYLGMTIDAACENANKKLNVEIAKICQPLMVTQNTDGTFKLVPSRDSQDILVPDIKTDTNGLVTSINIKKELSEILFNSSDMGNEEFTQTFMEAYDIPEMQLQDSILGRFMNIKQYKSPLGYNLTICNGCFELTVVPKKSERKFGD